jgi:hypothetical protein
MAAPVDPTMAEPDKDEAQDVDFETAGDGDPNIEEHEDGSATITLDDLDDSTEVEEDGDHWANLAETLINPLNLLDIARDLEEAIRLDQEARKERDEQYAEGIKRTGLGDEAPGGASFPGASKVVHPMLTKACIDFAARAIKELFPRTGPDGGPVKDQIIGKPTQEKVDKADRKTRYMNWQLQHQMPEFRDTLEQLLTQTPLAGAQYLKMSFDKARKRPIPDFISSDHMLLPYAATSYLGAERKTHVQFLTTLEFEKRIKSGMYRDTEVGDADMPEETAAALASDKIEGRDSDPYNKDGLRTVYEVYCWLDVEEDPQTGGEPAPYIVTLDDASNEILAVYRNWDPEDEDRAEMDWIVQWPFVPWRGAMPIGFIHMIGSLSGAATGSLRALLDAAHAANSQTLVKLKGAAGRGGQNMRVQPQQIVEIDGTNMQDPDIRKTIMPLPFNQPNAVLLQLLGFLVDSGEQMVRTTFDGLTDQNAQQPVGTTLALIEQGMTVFNAIHARLHDAMGRTLKILHRLNKMYLREQEVVEDLGELMVKRSDFDGPVDIVPVSDPNIFSDVQRTAQVQMIAQRAALLPQLYDLRKVEELILERTKVPDAKDLLIPKPEPQRLNPVNENLAAALGRPVIAFPDQDHLAHLKVHVDFLMNPLLGMNPVVGAQFVPAILGHLKEHLLYWYVTHTVELGTAFAGQDVSELMEPDDPEVSAEFDKLMAHLSMAVNHDVMEQFQALAPILQQAMQMAQQLAPPQMDPNAIAAATVKVQQDAIQEKREYDQGRLQIEQAKLAASQGADQMDDATKRKTNTDDNMTAITIATMRGQSAGPAGAGSGLKNGTGINPNP